MNKNPNWISRYEAALTAGISERQLSRWIRSGGVEVWRGNSRYVLVSASSLQAKIQKNTPPDLGMSQHVPTRSCT
jgi:hypothetical protein